MTRLLIVRHGQTVWNTLHRMQGQHDSPLTPLGRELTRHLALRLADTHLDGVYFSPLGRARDTAGVLMAGRDLPATPDGRLMELNLGRWEGEDMTTMAARLGVDMDAFWRSPDGCMDMRGGETYASLLARTGDFLSGMAGREGTYLVVTHAIALRAIRQRALGLDTFSSRMSMPSCCLCQLDMEGGALDLRLCGDSYHHSGSILSWWHGSPEVLTELRAGSTITRIRPLAEAFSHKPRLLCIATDSAITHDGTRPGHMYRVAEPVLPGDVEPHPRSAMPLTYEFVTRRALRLEPADDLPEPDGDAGPELTLNV